MSGAMSKLRATLLLASTALVVLTLAACGVPVTSPPTAITEVPYNLMETAAPPAPLPSTPARRGPFIYWVNAADQLVAIEAGTTTGDAPDTAAAVLTRLAQGPSELERESGLSTALGPDVSLTVNRIEGSRADIDVTIGPPGPSARRLPLAVGQIVLSLTSTSGIDSVWLMSEGTPIEAPLPEGALTARPLTAQDFTALVEAGQPSPATPRAR
jgi:spore germination protein GerM